MSLWRWPEPEKFDVIENGRGYLVRHNKIPIVEVKDRLDAALRIAHLSGLEYLPALFPAEPEGNRGRWTV